MFQKHLVDACVGVKLRMKGKRKLILVAHASVNMENIKKAAAVLERIVIV